MLINEVQFDPVQEGRDGAYEWIELLNASAKTIDLEGWKITDNSGEDLVAGLRLRPGELGILAAGPGFYENFPVFTTNISFVSDGNIGNSLNNEGDRLALISSGGTIVDSLSYGNDESYLSPGCIRVSAGHSLERRPAGIDTDQASDFIDNDAPSPGLGLTAPASTPSASASPALTPVPTPSPAPSATVGPSVPPGPPLPTDPPSLVESPLPIITGVPGPSPGTIPAASPAGTPVPDVTLEVTPTPWESNDGTGGARIRELLILVVLSAVVLGSLIMARKAR